MSVNFIVSQDKCIVCGQCVKDCPMKVLGMDGYPIMKREEGCIKCQHCLAVCPTAAISILNKDPEDSINLKGNLPGFDQVETLIKGRRSIRSYSPIDIDKEEMKTVLETALHAPSGVNSRKVLFTVIDSKVKMDKLFNEIVERIIKDYESGKIPDSPAKHYIDWVYGAWTKHQSDILFRSAPHLLISSAPLDCPTPHEDCLIAMSYFELAANAKGFGVLWNGIMKMILEIIYPDLKEKLGIPENHKLGYVMTFGIPRVVYKRTVQHDTNINYI